MWRISGFVGRVLSRCHGNNSSLRLKNHVEDEVISSSTVLSTNWSQRGEDGEQDKKNKRTTKEFYFAGLPRYTALDAVGWGAAAVLFMQLCKRVHSQFSSVGEQNPGLSRHPESIHRCTHRILFNMLWNRDVLPRGLCLVSVKGTPKSPEQSSSSSSVHNYSTNTQPAHTSSDQQEETLSDIYTEESVHEGAETHETQPCDNKDPDIQRSLSLEEAEQNLKDVTDSSVPIILNIMGLKSADAGDYEAAFECFLASAHQNYSKAQFNVGVCYEKGWGVKKDLNKALHYYRFAADAGHTQAQYRCAKLLLKGRGQQRATDTHTATALSLLRSAAAAGLTQAQLYLGVVLSQDPAADGVESVRYFQTAAQSGNSTGLLFMGQCYDSGFGVSQCYRTALSYYERAAAKGNQKATDILRDLHCREVLRSIRSAPCLSVLDAANLDAVFPCAYLEAGLSTQQQPDRSTQPLPHSWSTGSLVAPPHLFAHALNSNGTSGGWIVGVG